MGAYRFFDDKHHDEPHKWNRAAKRDGVRRRVFVGSMCDWAERHAVPEVDTRLNIERGRLFNLIEECTSLDWLLLTKRIGDVAPHLPWCSMDGEQVAAPWPHVWIGCTAGTVGAWLHSVSLLRGVPAAVRFVSCEPMLESIPLNVLDDGLRGGMEYIGPGQVETIRQMIESLDVIESAFLDFMRVESIEGIQVKDYTRAVNALNKKKASGR